MKVIGACLFHLGGSATQCRMVRTTWTVTHPHTPSILSSLSAFTRVNPSYSLCSIHPPRYFSTSALHGTPSATTTLNPSVKSPRKKSIYVLLGSGLAIFAAWFIWRYPFHRQLGIEQKSNNSSRNEFVVDSPWQLKLLLSLPLRWLSRYWGYLHNECNVPSFLRAPLYQSYAYLFNCNLSELHDPDLRSYPNLGAFFQRAINLTYRPHDPTALLVSPTDSTVISISTFPAHPSHLPFAGAQPIHVKHVTYPLAQLVPAFPPQADPPTALTPETASAPRTLSCITLYLAPGDYHRCHAPFAFDAHTLHHVAGELLSVAPPLQRAFPHLLSLNERVCLVGRWAHGNAAMVLVGATHVGNIFVHGHPELQTNLKDPLPRLRTMPRTGAIPFQIMQEVGGFRLGSTVVLVVESPAGFTWTVRPGEKVKVGQVLAEVKASGT